MQALAKAFKSTMDFIRFRTKLYVSTWVFASGIKPAECKVDWIAVAAVQVVTITSVAVSYTNHVTVMLQPDH